MDDRDNAIQFSDPAEKDQKIVDQLDSLASLHTLTSIKHCDTTLFGCYTVS